MGKTTSQKSIDIVKVWDYKSGSDSCNSVYIGGMAAAGAIRRLGGRYGIDDDIKKLVASARPEQIDDCHDYLKSTIDFMKKNPVHLCPHCGQVMKGKA